MQRTLKRRCVKHFTHFYQALKREEELQVDASVHLRQLSEALRGICDSVTDLEQDIHGTETATVIAQNINPVTGRLRLKDSDSEDEAPAASAHASPEEKTVRKASSITRRKSVGGHPGAIP